MTAEGRLARGKLNYDSGKFLDNPETLEYSNSLPKEKPNKEEVKPKEKKNDGLKH